jgi:hypothetical protein
MRRILGRLSDLNGTVKTDQMNKTSATTLCQCQAISSPNQCG